MAHLTLHREFLETPPVTRVYTSACIITTLLVVWRIFTTFLFFGTIGFNFFFNMIFTYRYCRMLEEGSFRGRTADFVLMMMFGAASLIFFTLFYSLPFLGQAFTIMIVYVWARRNPFIRMNFFGFTFHAPYLPWVLLGFSFLLGNSVLVDLMGIAVGHTYYFLEDVFPQHSGFRLLRAPQFLKQLLEPRTAEPGSDVDPPPPVADLPPDQEDRQPPPGGFNWG